LDVEATTLDLAWWSGVAIDLPNSRAGSGELPSAEKIFI
jgi:hypothetical protein